MGWKLRGFFFLFSLPVGQNCYFIHSDRVFELSQCDSTDREGGDLHWWAWSAGTEPPRLPMAWCLAGAVQEKGWAGMSLHPPLYLWNLFPAFHSRKLFISLLRKAMSLALLFVKSSLVSQVCGVLLFCFITQLVSFGIHVLVRQILFFICTPGLLVLQSALNVL